MGGRIIINSDSHSADTIAYAFDQAQKLAYDCGFRKVTVLNSTRISGDSVRIKNKSRFYLI